MKFDKKESLYAIQIKLEDEAIRIGQEHYRKAYSKAISKRTVSYRQPERKLIDDTIKPLADALELELLLNNKTDKTIRNILRKVHPLELAFIITQTAINITITRSKPTRFATVASDIGKRIGQQIEYIRFKASQAIDKAKGQQKFIILNRAGLHEECEGKAFWINDKVTVHKVGAWCLNILIHGKGSELFEVKCTHQSANKSENHFIIKPSALEWLQEAHRESSLMSPLFLPMVVPPVEWGQMTGGFLSNAGPYRLPAVRSKNGQQQRETGCVLDCLNALQRTPYRINRRILAVLQTLNAHSVDEGQGEDIKGNMRLSQQLFIADKFKDFNEIFFCWFADWRGRVYPVQQFLNPQADSTGKALLEFANGKPLGNDGDKWLAIHGANTFGETESLREAKPFGESLREAKPLRIDKVSFEDRLAWVQDHQDLIIESARNPLSDDCLWTKAKKPFMFLAFCFEWAEYLNQGESFQSHLPVSVDGSCSGLQHYSALLRDETCGQYVNLIPGDRPQDIYEEVAKESQRIVSAEADNECSKKWNGKIDRSFTKRNTMTFTYSATLHGFSEQIMDAWRKLAPGKTHLAAEPLTTKDAFYLAKVNLDSIKKTTVKAGEAMDYLKDVARVATDSGIALSWVTPSGFRVDHRYNKPQLKTVTTLFGSTRIRTTVEIGKGRELDTRKTLSRRRSLLGIAPNFIHSLDAAHLALTVTACEKEGLTDFMMIHDSFGCHAADMPKMNRILREEFARMYNEDILNDFHEQVRRQIPGDTVGRLPGVPAKGELEVGAVKLSDYFFA